MIRILSSSCTGMEDRRHKYQTENGPHNETTWRGFAAAPDFKPRETSFIIGHRLSF